MIISVSRRTDIPAFYASWFFERLREGFCYTQNPMNARQVNQVSLRRDVVDGIVFWTKNPHPMLDGLNEIAHFPYYFQFTLTAYGQDMERHLPPKEALINTFHELAKRTSPQHVVWRYDPIILTPTYTLDFHLQNFALLAKKLEGAAHRVVISFVDYYAKIAKKWRDMKFQTIGFAEKNALAAGFTEAARSHGFIIESCAEDMDLASYNIAHSRCINDSLLTRISGVPLSLCKDTGQRTACGCVTSVDIGMYNSCAHGCHYCYASYSQESVRKNMQKHDPHYPLLLGTVPEGVLIKEKKQVAYAQKRKSLFDILS